jgi:hypothetical protein
MRHPYLLAALALPLSSCATLLHHSTTSSPTPCRYYPTLWTSYAAAAPQLHTCHVCLSDHGAVLNCEPQFALRGSVRFCIWALEFIDTVYIYVRE